MNKLKINANPIEELIDNMSGIKLKEIIYLCEHGVIEKLNAPAKDRKMYDESTDSYFFKPSQSSVFNTYFEIIRNIQSSIENQKELKHFIEQYCLDFYKDNDYIKNNIPKNQRNTYIKSLTQAEKIILYFYAKGLDVTHNNYEFFDLLIYNYDYTFKNQYKGKEKTIIDVNFKECLDIIGSDIGWDILKKNTQLLTHKAVSSNYIQSIDFLSEKGFDFKEIDSEGFSVVFKANSFDMVSRVLKMSPELVNTKNKEKTVFDIIKKFSGEEKVKVSALIKKHVENNSRIDFKQDKDQEYKNLVDVLSEKSMTKTKFIKVWRKSNISDLNYKFEYKGLKTTLLGHFLDFSLNRLDESGRNVMKSYYKSFISTANFLIQEGAFVSQTIERTSEKKNKKYNILEDLTQLLFHNENLCHKNLPARELTQSLILSQKEKIDWSLESFNSHLLNLSEKSFEIIKNNKEKRKYGCGLIWRSKVEADSFPVKVDFLFSLYQEAFSSKESLLSIYEKRSINIIFDSYHSWGEEENGMLISFFKGKLRDEVLRIDGYMESKNEYMKHINQVFLSCLETKHIYSDLITNFMEDAIKLSHHLINNNEYAEDLFVSLNKMKENNLIEPESERAFVSLNSILEKQVMTKKNNTSMKKKSPSL